MNLLLWVVPSSALNGTGELKLLNGSQVASVSYAANRLVLWRGLEPRFLGNWKSGFLQRGIHLLLTFGALQCDA